MAEISEIVTVTQLSPPSTVSEPNPLVDLSDFERKSLEELRVIVQEALDKQEFSARPAPPPAAVAMLVEEKEMPLPLAATSEVVEEVAPTQEPNISAEVAEVLGKETDITFALPAAAAATAVPVEEKEMRSPPPAIASEAVEEIVSTQEPKISAEVVEVLGKGTNIPSSPTELKTEEKEMPPPPPPPAVVITAEPPEIETHTAKSEIVEEIAQEKPPESAAVAFATDAAEVAELSGEGTDITSSPEEVSIWGVPLLKDNRSDVILLKFLRARNFKVKDAFEMLRNTIKWRLEFNIDALINEDLGDNLDKVVFMHGFDKEGHPVCYSVYGEFQNRELYQKTFVDEVKRTKFLQWWIQLLERSIRKLDFSPDGINTICQVSDLKNWPGPGKTELKIASRQLQQLHKDNYPEFFAKQVFINVPWWYAALCMIFYPFLPQGTKSKLAFASQSKAAETLFKYISPEQVPIQYGGLSVDFCDRNPEFSIDDPATEITVEPAAKQVVEIPVNEECIIVWELRVVGWEVSYGAEYVPNEEGTYTVVIQKPKKMAPTDEPVVCTSFKISELGKIVLTIDNFTSKRKKLVYRFKVKPFCN